MEVRPHQELAELVSHSNADHVLGAVVGNHFDDLKIWAISGGTAGCPDEPRFMPVRTWADLYLGTFDRLWAGCSSDPEEINRISDLITLEIEAALDAARSAQFEWGESGAT